MAIGDGRSGIYATGDKGEVTILNALNFSILYFY
jgi:hypothetical protein